MKIEPITSSQNPRFRSALKLHTSRGRQTQNRILVIGRREVSRALRAGLAFEELMLVDSAPVGERDFAQMLEQVQKDSTRISSVANRMFEKLAYGDREATIIGIALRPPTGLDRLSQVSAGGESGALVLVLEALEKPGNLGAIARSADAGGASAILMADTRTDIFHPNAIRSSVATVFSVPIGCGTTAEVQAWLSRHGFQVCYATPEASRSLFQANLTGKVAIVIGNEAQGISGSWRTEPAMGIHVPMVGIGDSLNASVTASLMIYEAYRQRTQSMTDSKEARNSLA
jgi:RNA methyltransferase, TrmH family